MLLVLAKYYILRLFYSHQRDSKDRHAPAALRSLTIFNIKRLDQSR